MQMRPSIAATNRVNWLTSVSVLLDAPMANSIVKTNSPTLYRTTLSRSKVVAMMRGVIWPLAT